MNKFEFNPKSLDAAMENQILSNVFRACDIEPNAVPLESIHEYRNYRKQRFLFQKTTIYSILVLFMLLPVLFITGTIIWTLNTDTSTYIIGSDSLIPVSAVDASIDGHSVAITALNDGKYLLTPNRNGVMLVTITLKNHQEIKTTVSVTSVDIATPLLKEVRYEAEFFYLIVDDADSGINYEGITVQTADGSDFTGLTVLPDDNQIKLEYPMSEITVCIPDLSGNTLILKLSPG